MRTIRPTDCTKNEKAPRLWRFFNSKVDAVGIFFTVVILAAYYWCIGCPFRFFLGLPCLGCGMTRAWGRILRGDILGAFYFHPLWGCPPLFIICFLWLRPKHRRLYRAVVLVMLLLFVGTFVIRLLAHSPVVAIDYTNGILYKLIMSIF